MTQRFVTIKLGKTYLARGLASEHEGKKSSVPFGARGPGRLPNQWLGWPTSQMLSWNVTTQLVDFQIVDSIHHTLSQQIHDMSVYTQSK